MSNSQKIKGVVFPEGLSDSEKFILTGIVKQGGDQQKVDQAYQTLLEWRMDEDRNESDPLQKQLESCHFYDMLYCPEVLRDMQTCLRSWFIAHMLEPKNEWFNNHHRNGDVIETYRNLDDFLDVLIEKSVILENDPDNAEALADSRDLIKGTFRTSDDLANTKDEVRNWFLDAMLESFEARADNLDQLRHTYIYTTLNELLMVNLYYKQDQNYQPAATA